MAAPHAGPAASASAPPPHHWRAFAGSVAAGCVHGLSFSPVFYAGPQAAPWGWVVQWFSLAAWVMCLAPLRSPAAAALGGWLFSTAWLSTATCWLFVSMHDYGHLSSLLSALAVLALSGFLSLYLAAAMAAFARQRSGAWGRDGVLFAAWCLLAELARGLLLTGFPWAAMGYAHVDGPLVALAPWVGVYGMGAVAAFLGYALACGLAGMTRAPMAWARWRAACALGVALGSMAALAWLPPGHWTRGTGTLSVSLLQTDVPQDEKFAAEHLHDNLDWAMSHLLSADSDLVLGPETVIPLLPEELPQSFWAPLRERFHQPGRHVLLGVPLGDAQQGYTNSVLGLSAQWPGDGAYRYDKHHLVPFGEFVPYGFHWFVRMLNIPLGDFARGTLEQPSFPVGAQRVAPNICYEDLFGEELAARFREPASAPTVMANVSNLAWFGRSMAIEQHLDISRLRALELQRPMIRSTNTGATVVIDHRGRVVAALAPYTRGVLRAAVQGRDGITPYAWWASRFGLWPLIVLGVAVVGAGGRRRQASTT